VPLVTPGLIDAHTHLVYGGDRAAEFERRLQGVPATSRSPASRRRHPRHRGGHARGQTTPRCCRPRPRRASALMAEGVTTIEVKSGYGLAREHEARCLAVARRLGRELATDRAHHVAGRARAAARVRRPPGRLHRRRLRLAAASSTPPAWWTRWTRSATPSASRRPRRGASSTPRARSACRSSCMPSNCPTSSGAALAAAYGALSCDHLEHLDAAGIQAMAAAGTVAMLLPGAYYFLREMKLPPVDALRRAGVPMAIATDHNPGSSPALSLLLMLNMACTLFRLTPEEALAGVTVHAARALGLADRGRLRAGLRADFAIWDADHPRELAYRFGHNPCRGRVVGGLTDPRPLPLPNLPPSPLP
jgi:imidazolonepropionase